MQLLDETHVRDAAERITGRVRLTPVVDLSVPDLSDRPVNFKLEQLQYSGSFKPRGAFNTLLSADVPEAGVICASGGNHGIAIAHVAKALGIHAEIYLPLSSSPVKVQMLRALGASVHQVGSVYGEAYEAMRERVRETGALEAHAYDQPGTVAGQGTLFREWLAQVPDLTTIVVAVGGGGLMAGALAAFGHRLKIVAVEPRHAPTLAEALDADQPVDVNVSGVASDSLGASRLGEIAFAMARHHGVVSVTVGDDEIVAAQKWLWGHARICAEPGGAAAMAGLLSRAYRPGRDERVGVLVCGANAEPSTIVG